MFIRIETLELMRFQRARISRIVALLAVGAERRASWTAAQGRGICLDNPKLPAHFASVALARESTLSSTARRVV